MTEENTQDLKESIKELQIICAESYQVVANLALKSGLIKDDDVTKAMDNLSRQELVHEDVLPFDPEYHEHNAEAFEALDKIEKFVLGMISTGRCGSEQLEECDKIRRALWGDDHIVEANKKVEGDG